MKLDNPAVPDDQLTPDDHQEVVNDSKMKESVSYNYNKSFLYLLLFFLSIIIIVTGFFFNPSFVSKYFSIDGILTKKTQSTIYFFQSIAVSIGCIVFIYSLLKITKRDFLKKIDRIVHISFVRRLSIRSMLIWIVFLYIITTSGLRIFNLYGRWENVAGYEYFWIARSIARGEGYSFNAHLRWLFVDFRSSYSPDEYFPTAWEEPVYPFLMAFLLKIFGKYGKLAILVFQVLFLFFCTLCLYYLGRKVFNWQTGVLAAFMLAWWPHTHYLAQGVLGPPMFAGLLICISAYLVVRCVEQVSVKRGIVLGTVLGFSCLTFAPSLLFIPVSALLIILSVRPLKPVVWKTALSVFLAAFIVVCPWTVRNLLVFGQFVPIRTGFGAAAHQGNPALAATLSAGPCAFSDTVGPPWQAENALEAIMIPRGDKEKRVAIYKRSSKCIEQEAPQGYERFNEAERDKIYLQKTIEFILSEPRTFAILSLNKLLAFFSGWGWRQGVVSLLALVGALAALPNRKARVLILLTLVYTFPYALSVTWFYRYRYPIEPILLLFASYLPIFISQKFKNLRLSRVEHLAT